MAEAAQPKMDGKMLFHAHHGRMVLLNRNRDKAEKFTIWRHLHDPVFSENPMEMGRLYEVCLEAVAREDHEVTSFGVVTQHPQTYPWEGFDISHSSVVYITYDGVWRWGSYEEERRDYLRKVPLNSRVGLALDRERTLHLFFNGQNMGEIARKIPKLCFFMYDVYLRADKIAALPITIIDELNQEPGAAEGGDQPVRKPAP